MFYDCIHEVSCPDGKTSDSVCIDFGLSQNASHCALDAVGDIWTRGRRLLLCKNTAVWRIGRRGVQDDCISVDGLVLW